MSKSQELENLLSPLITDAGYEVVDVTFEKVGSDWILTTYIDKEDGDITLEDCEAVNNIISPFLDKEDPIEQSYLLEVSSPGLDRPLKKEKDYMRNIGNEIEINLYAKKNGKKEIIGILKDYKDKVVTIESDGELLEIPVKEISKAAPVVEI